MNYQVMDIHFLVSVNGQMVCEWWLWVWGVFGVKSQY